MHGLPISCCKIGPMKGTQPQAEDPARRAVQRSTAHRSVVERLVAEGHAAPCSHVTVAQPGATAERQQAAGATHSHRKQAHRACAQEPLPGVTQFAWSEAATVRSGRMRMCRDLGGILSLRVCVCVCVSYGSYCRCLHCIRPTSLA